MKAIRWSSKLHSIRVTALLCVAAAVLGLAMPVVATAVDAPACAGWTYLSSSLPLIDSGTPDDGSVVLGDASVSIGGACPPVPGKIRTGPKGTTVRARWASCAGLIGPVSFRAKIAPSCQTMSDARLTARGFKKQFVAVAVATASGLQPRAIFSKPAVTSIDPERHSAHQVVVKFHEGTRIRMNGPGLAFDGAALDEEDRARMRRNALTEAQVRGDVDRANALLFGRPGIAVSNLFERSDDSQGDERPSLESDLLEEMADLGLYYVAVLDQLDVATAEELVDRLNALRSVEISYAEPLPAEPAVDIAPTTTIDVRPSQGYLGKAPSGIDADWSWRLPGGRGFGIRVVDIESGWTKDHEDLPGSYFAENGWNFAYGDHGAAVLGVLAAADNGYGATGIVPDIAVGLSSPIWSTFYSPHNTAAAVDNAAKALRPGDVLVIEQHYPSLPIPSGVACDPNCDSCGTLESQFGYLPAEAVPAVFDAVRRATAKGIIVVEAAGNGQMNLDDPSYDGRFDRNVRDSGAIIVGAGFPSSRSAQCFTNFGSRVDLQGWGSGVATVGYGEAPSLRANGGDARQFYTQSFSGTSSATPIVAGAAVAVNGSRLADGDPLLDSPSMRQMLRATGSAQSPVDALSRQIGPLPNLRKAMPGVAGRVDEIRADGIARGWAFHSAQPGTSIEMHFYVDGAWPSGVWAGSAIANTSRPDVNGYFSIVGSHGFEFRIPDAFRDGTTHTLFAYGIDPTSSGRNRLLQQVLTFNLPGTNPPEPGCWFGTDDGFLPLVSDVVRYHVDHGVVQADAVEWVLDTAGRELWRKRLVLDDGLGGRWTIETNGAVMQDRNGLYVYQLPQGHVEVWKAGFLGVMNKLVDLPTACFRGGDRITVTWLSD